MLTIILHVIIFIYILLILFVYRHMIDFFVLFLVLFFVQCLCIPGLPVCIVTSMLGGEKKCHLLLNGEKRIKVLMWSSMFCWWLLFLKKHWNIGSRSSHLLWSMVSCLKNGLDLKSLIITQHSSDKRTTVSLRQYIMFSV